jgi:hypothetical protein
MTGFYPISTADLILCLVMDVGGGFLSGFLGIGGGSVMVPLFVILLGMDMYEAVGTSLLTIVIYAIPGSIDIIFWDT